MEFANLGADLTLNDKLDLLSVQLELSFEGENSELSKMFLGYFPGNKVVSKMDSPGVYKVAAKVPLTDEGKKSIKTLIADLKALDKQFGERVGLVNDFKKLLGE